MVTDLRGQEDVEWGTEISTHRFICTRNRHKITQASWGGGSARFRSGLPGPCVVRSNMCKDENCRGGRELTLNVITFFENSKSAAKEAFARSRTPLSRLSRRRFRIFEKCNPIDRQFSPSSTLFILTHFRSDNARPRQTGAKSSAPPGHDACVILCLLLVQMKRCVDISAPHSTSSCWRKADRIRTSAGLLRRARNLSLSKSFIHIQVYMHTLYFYKYIYIPVLSGPALQQRKNAKIQL